MSMKGKFVRWTATDDQGEFSHVGECIGDSKTMMIILTDKGEMLIDKSEGTFEETRKPKNWAAGTSPAVAPVTPKATKAAKAERAPAKRKAKAAPKAAKAEKTPRTGSKIAEAVAILSAADRSSLSRQQMIALLKEQMGIEDHKKASGLYQSAIKKVA